MSDLKYGECPYCGRAMSENHRCWQKSAIGSLKEQSDTPKLSQVEVERLTQELAQAKEDMAQWKFRFEECESDWEKAIKDLAQAKKQLAAKDAWIEAIIIPFHEHEAKVLEEVADELNKQINCPGWVGKELRRMAQERRKHGT